MDQPGVLVEKLQSLADLKQAFLDLELVNLELTPPPHTIRILGDIATRSTPNAACSLLLVLFLQQASQGCCDRLGNELKSTTPCVFDRFDELEDVRVTQSG